MRGLERALLAEYLMATHDESPEKVLELEALADGCDWIALAERLAARIAEPGLAMVHQRMARVARRDVAEAVRIERSVECEYLAQAILSSRYRNMDDLREFSLFLVALLGTGAELSELTEMMPELPRFAGPMPLAVAFWRRPELRRILLGIADLMDATELDVGRMLHAGRLIEGVIFEAERQRDINSAPRDQAWAEGVVRAICRAFGGGDQAKHLHSFVAKRRRRASKK